MTPGARRLDEKTLSALEGAAQRFEKSHQTWLSEAENIVRARRDATAAYHLLAGLRTSPEARRPGPALALDDVGRWVEKRLFEEPDIDPERFLTEVGWLKRFATIAAERPGAQGGKDKPGGTAGQTVNFGFGDRVDELREKRERALRKPKPKPKAVEPAGLPTWVEAGFRTLPELTEVRKTTRERWKKARKKAKRDLTPQEQLEAVKKDRVLDLRVDDPAWKDKIQNLQASVTSTQGFLELIASDEPPKIWAKLPDGYVEGSTEPVVVPEIRLAPPSE